jgi:capsular polysaccharide biosynthesis protein
VKAEDVGTDANISTQLVERAEPIGAEPVIRVGARLSSCDPGKTFVLPSHTATVEQYHMKDVVVDGHTGVIFTRSGQFERTGYSQGQFAPILNLDRVVALDDGRLGIVAFHAWHCNYYHWLLQCVPALVLAREVNRESEIVFLMHELTAWQEDLMRVFDLHLVPRIKIDRRTQYMMPRLYFNDLSQGASVRFMSRTLNRIINSKRDLTPSDFSGQILYVSRFDSSSRRMTNERLLCEELSNLDVRVICPGSLAVDEQISLFSSAAAVIGPHGAGLANVAFCRPGTIVYEIMSTERLNRCYAILCQSLGLEYWGECYSPLDGSAPAGEWEADINDVVTTVNLIRTEVSRRRLEYETV